MTKPRSWYAEGLRFSCRRSGNCCTGEPGFTWLSDREACRLAARLGLDDAAFRRRYTATAWIAGEPRLVLRDRPGSRGHECLLWDGQGCAVYDERPRQCRTWPFWRRNVASPDAWNALAAECPGIGTGDLHLAAEIDRVSADDGLASRQQ